MQPVIFDIETAPLPPEALERYMKPFPERPPFDAGTVKTGDIDRRTKLSDDARDKLKAEKIENARTAYYEESAKLKADYEKKQHDEAALSPVTGTVLVVGLYRPANDQYAFLAADADGLDEATVLDIFWSQVLEAVENSGRLIGLNIFNFDLPFMVRRSWILGVDVPRQIRKGRYWSDVFIDLADVWLCGQRFGSVESNFNAIAQALGLDGKPNGMTGAGFAKAWKEDRTKAVAYLKNDLYVPARMAMKMGVVEDYGARKAVAEPEPVEAEA